MHLADAHHNLAQWRKTCSSYLMPSLALVKRVLIVYNTRCSKYGSGPWAPKLRDDHLANFFDPTIHIGTC